MDKNKFQLNVEVTSNQNESDFNLNSILKMYIKLFSFVIQAEGMKCFYANLCKMQFDQACFSSA